MGTMELHVVGIDATLADNFSVGGSASSATHTTRHLLTSVAAVAVKLTKWCESSPLSQAPLLGLGSLCTRWDCWGLQTGDVLTVP